MDHPYRDFVAAIDRALTDARALPAGGFSPAPRPALPPDAPVAVILAPHPDDECIVGGLPLRLRREAGFRVVDVAVTLGSNQARRAGRRAELAAACAFLGFDLALPASEGLERVSARTRAAEPAHWGAAADALAATLAPLAPRVVFLPHAEDWNGTHIGTHWLGLDALARAGAAVEGALVIETEFWGAMTDPNLMVESSAADVGDLVAATSFHAGEIARNPYHLRLPGWMIDNVRRGSELVGGQGATAPAFGFATLYRASVWKGGALAPLPDGSARILGAAESPLSLVPRSLKG